MKVAIVTGSERGIGRAIAKLLSENGFTVVSASVANEGDELVTSLLDELRKNAPDSMYVKTDISKPSDRENLVRTVVSSFFLRSSSCILSISAERASRRLQSSSSFCITPSSTPASRPKRWFRFTPVRINFDFSSWSLKIWYIIKGSIFGLLLLSLHLRLQK